VKKDYSWVVGKVGYCRDVDLGLKGDGGHYVYIRDVGLDYKCNVNVVTSLERGKKKYDLKHIGHVRSGYTYAIPKYDANFAEWSGLKKDVISDVDISNIREIGVKRINPKHRVFVDKYLQ
jgi:hypothetical protein